MGIASGKVRRQPDATWLGGATGPLHAVEIAARRVTAVELKAASGAPVVSWHATEALPPGAVTPSLGHPNIRDVDAVTGALARALDRIGGRPKRVGLVIPDAATRVSIVRFETIPARAQDLDELIKWQVRKGAPFRVEEAQLTYVPGAAVGSSGREYIVVLARRDVVEEYEGICARLGMHAGLVDIASFNVINAALVAAARGGEVADWLFVQVTAEDTTLAIIRDGAPIFFRNRPAAEGSLEDLVHQTAMYYEDRLGGRGLGRVVVAGGADRPPGSEDVRRSIEMRLGVPVEAADPRGAVSLHDRHGVGPDLLDALAAPVGLLLRDRVRAA
jgi:type IV pilus assembly protein PilM